MNRQIAADLTVSELTVKAHRGQRMRKVRAKSVAEPVRMADQLGVAAGKSEGLNQSIGRIASVGYRSWRAVYLRPTSRAMAPAAARG